jgi:flagellar basal body-associated protein FliL
MSNFLALFLQSSSDAASQQAMHATMVMIPIFLVIGLVCLAIIVIPFWFICKKAGFSPWLTLLNIIPVGNLVLIYVLAFAEWKVVPAPQQVYYPPQPPYPQPPLPPQPPAPPQA